MGLWRLVAASGRAEDAQYARHGMPFNLGWWAFTFPLGVYTLATMALARVTHLEFFSIAGSVLALSLAGFWLVVATRTLHGVWFGYFSWPPALPRRSRKLEVRYLESGRPLTAALPRLGPEPAFSGRSGLSLWGVIIPHALFRSINAASALIGRPFLEAGSAHGLMNAPFCG